MKPAAGRRAAILGLGAGALLAVRGLAAQGSYSGTTSGLDLMDVEVMFVGAHPDDDTDILATFARYLNDEGFKGTVITLTGGEGGGNAIGREAGRSLGLIREEEERRSLARVGVSKPHFLGLSDFYFTLSAEEAAARWGDRFLCDVVRHVRVERPEVIVTMWPGPGTHGMHQMASRAATLAFERAGDASFCPEQVTGEFLRPFTPLKLYYFTGGRTGPGIVPVPTNDWSRSGGMRYVDLKALAVREYRSQGYDRGVTVPAAKADPETFLLARSRVTVPETETHLLGGALLPGGASPAGTMLEIEPAAFETAVGKDLPVLVRFQNPTSASVAGVVLALVAAEGWVVTARGPSSVSTLAPGEGFEARFTVSTATATADGAPAPLEASFAARSPAGPMTGRNRAFVRAVPPLRAEWTPRFDVASYREFARRTRTDWVIPLLPARVPVAVGRTNRVGVTVTNEGSEVARGEWVLEAPAGVTLDGSASFTASAGARAETSLGLAVTGSALPEGRHSARVPITLKVPTSGSRDLADLYILPALVVPRVTKTPLIDGDLADLSTFASGSISPKDRWWRAEPNDAADLSADFFLGHDGRHLFVGIRVRDDVVACNISPLDVKSQLRSDAVGVTVDPSGKSLDTSTTFQAAAFPCTTSGFGARGFRDADARPGLMETTAPGMQVVSRRTESGYEMELALPFSAMPSLPRPGDEIGLNIVLYDGDQKDAPVGANISESGLAWAAFQLGGKQALPYLWPRVTLAR